MDPNDHDSPPHLLAASKRLAQQTFVICENRLQLLLLEVQEERARVVRAFWLSLATAVFGLLAGVTFTALITVACWSWSPVAALAILLVLYTGVAAFLYSQIVRLYRGWESFADTFKELQKDRECLEKSLN